MSDAKLEVQMAFQSTSCHVLPFYLPHPFMCHTHLYATPVCVPRPGSRSLFSLSAALLPTTVCLHTPLSQSSLLPGAQTLPSEGGLGTPSLSWDFAFTLLAVALMLLEGFCNAVLHAIALSFGDITEMVSTAGLQLLPSSLCPAG